jgi:cytochrome c5
MNRYQGVLAFFFCFISYGYAQVYPVYPSMAAVAKSKRAQVQRGEYLVKAGDCIACHTEPGGKPFSGGLGMKTPFGTFYTPNITPDPVHGLGSWTEKDFVRAVQKGINPHNQDYFPVFPYPYFNRVTDQDLKDIFAYLQEIPTVNKPNKVHDVPFPFSWRFTQVFWRFLFFDDKGPYQYNNKHTKAWNRGAYLVEGLGHCNMCHGPINLLGAPKKALAFTGSDVSGAFAPNITGSNLKHVTIEEVVRVFTHDELPGGTKVNAEQMKEVNHNSLSRLKTSDLRAIAMYLRSLKDPNDFSVGHHTGHEIYQTYCAGCHAAGAGGAPKFGDEAVWKTLLDTTGEKKLLHNAIHGIRSMPAKGTCLSCSDVDIRHALDFMIEHSMSGGASLRKRPHGKPIKPLTLKDGARIFAKHCASCHAQGREGKAPKIGDRKAWRSLLINNVDGLFVHVVRGEGEHPVRGGCTSCRDAELLAAIKYLVQNSSQGDYRLW